jgi:pimeloyl-ACP methyl ester carboxylesterase
MGEEDYMFLPSIEKLASLQSSAQLAVVMQCGHVVNVEQPTVFNTTTLRFLNGV